MKIIDLLNKIANEEELPKKIKYIGYIFEYDTNHKRYEAYIDGCMYALNEYVNIDEDLTYEVEIIEEENKIKIDKYKLFIDEKDAYTYIYNKLIEVVDVVNEMRVNK